MAQTALSRKDPVPTGLHWPGVLVGIALAALLGGAYLSLHRPAPVSQSGEYDVSSLSPVLGLPADHDWTGGGMTIDQFEARKFGK
jgi:hypothetical protein